LHFGNIAQNSGQATFDGNRGLDHLLKAYVVSRRNNQMSILTVPLASRRLTLRKPNRADAQAIRRLADDWEVASGLARVPHPYTLSDAHFFLETVVPREAVWILENARSGEPVGVAGLTPLNQAGYMELGYWLGRAFWGQGLATEAARTILDYTFGARIASKIAAGYFADKLRSERVLRKLGFQITGESTRSCLPRGKKLRYHDMLLTR
jgi:RimJ/RimL family protein N-acetyltransferase